MSTFSFSRNLTSRSHSALCLKFMPSIRTANYRQEVSDALEDSRDLDAAVAFASNEGLNFANIRVKLENLLRNNGNARILIDLRLGNTHPDFLEQLLDWQAEKLDVQCRHYESANGLFHPKLYIFHLLDNSKRAITGSANWTGEAYSNNVEHGVVLEGSTTDPLLSEIQSVFEQLWSSQNAKDITFDVLQTYRPYWRKWRGLDRRSKRRASVSWGRVNGQLEAEIPRTGFQWPSRDAAFFLGSMTARGSIDKQRMNMNIRLRYGGKAYSHNGVKGYIGKGNVTFDAASVVHLVPHAIAERIRIAVSPSLPIVRQLGEWTYEVEVDYTNNAQLLDNLSRFFGNNYDYQTFRVPRQIMSSDDRDLQEDFIRGYALACGLVSGGTYSPTGEHQVIFRPATPNIRQFEQIVNVLEGHFGIVTYKHRRITRDVGIKVRCEDWLDIGFGVDWLDSIVEEGARLNGALAPPQIP